MNSFIMTEVYQTKAQLRTKIAQNDTIFAKQPIVGLKNIDFFCRKGFTL